MRLRLVTACACLSILLNLVIASPAHASSDLLAAIPPGSDVLIGYFYVAYAPEDVYLEAWNHYGISTVRVTLRGQLGTVAKFEDVTGPGLLYVAEDRSTATIDAELPTLGHLDVQFNWLGSGLGFEISGGASTFSYHLVSPSGQLTSPFYRWSANMGSRQLVTAINPVFGRDAAGVTYRTPI